jgi:uncharacterized membrane protein
MMIEETFRQIVGHIALAVEAASVLIVTAGVLDALARIATAIVRQATPHGVGKAIWRRMGMWLLLGLEFALAADIIRSVVSPTWRDIGELAAIAAIRTFLNLFLEKDLEETAEEEQIHDHLPRMHREAS